MRSTIIARNYADTLLALAERHGGAATVQEFERAIDDVAALIEREPRVREFLGTPRVNAEEKKHALRAAFAGRVPELFLRFLLVVVDKNRQGDLRGIAAAYRDRVDELLGRVRADITLSHPADSALQDEIQRALETRVGRKVLPSFTVDPGLIGGMVVRIGDTIMDGSVRSRATELRQRLRAVRLPAGASAA